MASRKSRRVVLMAKSRSNVPIERQQIDHNDRRKDSQLSAPIGLLDRDFNEKLTISPLLLALSQREPFGIMALRT